MSAEPILFIIGSGDDSDRVVQTGAMQISVAGSSDLHKLLHEREPYELLHVSRNFFRQTREKRLLHYRVLVNLITEPEQSSRTLDNLRKLLRGVPGKVINPPDAVVRSTRDKVARMLSGIPGLIVPKAARLRGDKPALAARMLDTAGIKPPIMLRQAGTHTGKTLALHNSFDEVAATLESGKEYIATQFVDFISPDGLYRKYRVFFIGPHVVLRHMYVSDDWNVHSADRARFMAHHPNVVAEEKALFESTNPFAPKVRDVFRAVRERIPLDFFGLDFGLLPDGNVLLFEANATMSFFPLWRSADSQFEYLTACVPPARAAFRELLGLA